MEKKDFLFQSGRGMIRAIEKIILVENYFLVLPSGHLFNPFILDLWSPFLVLTTIVPVILPFPCFPKTLDVASDGSSPPQGILIVCVYIMCGLCN
jgi:hypothetical protein